MVSAESVVFVACINVLGCRGFSALLCHKRIIVFFDFSGQVIVFTG
jgi:hypothetical protein